MFDGEVVLHLLQPYGLLPYRIWCLVQPGECGVIRSDAESTSQETLLEIAEKVYHSEQFLGRHAIVSLPHVQRAATERSYSFHTLVVM